jgi:glycine/D-amino acid oxidase-like deaminating enzyme
VTNSGREPLPPVHGRCYWLREALESDPGEPCPPLRGSTSVDVAVVGGGYTGLWTAFFLTETDPGVSVAVLEADICGSGPSGRNGGFVTGWWDDLPDLIDLYGEARAVEACRAVAGSVAGIGEWCRRHGVDAWFTRNGYLSVSASPAQDSAPVAAVRSARRLGVGEEYVALSSHEVAARCRSTAFRGGALMRDGATVQPARLARGLRRVLLERGVRIFEGTPVTALRGGPPVSLRTPHGNVRAGRTVLAINAWASAIPAFRRSIVAWGSHIVLTAPAPDRLEEIGWTGGEAITDFRSAVHYFRTTPDGRVAFGGGGGRSAFRIGLGRRLAADPASIRRADEGLRRLLPAFKDVPLEEAWGGPIDVSGSHLPFFLTSAPGTIHVGAGYSGNGVAPSHLGGRILAALALGGEDPVTRLPMVQADPVRFPPEPVRTIGAHLVREAVIRKERADDAARRVNPVVGLLATLPRKMGYHWGPSRRTS